MRILLDECVPRAIKRNLLVGGNECFTVPEVGFTGKTNGELLALAEHQFEVFVTLDKGLQFQQNLGEYVIGILVIRAKSSRVADILPLIPACFTALRQIKPGQTIQIGKER